jgi:isopenicillin N synthase-like dioxygenase
MLAAAPENIPIIDLSHAFGGGAGARRDIAEQIDRACRDIGFFQITGHGVAPELVADLRRVGFGFFDLPEAEKLDYEAGLDSNFAGYVRDEALSYRRGDASPPDLKESYTAYPPGRGSDVPWTVPVPGFEGAMTAYFLAMDGLAAEMMRLFAIGLGLPERYFDPTIDQSLSALRVLHYPRLVHEPRPGQLRAGAHTDFGSLTLLLTDDAPGGLQVLAKSGAWIDVPHVPGGFVVNIGDLMAQWTNDRWVSTMHRVVTPAVGSASRRLSAAFFHQPNDDALITPLPTCKQEGEPDRYPPVTSGDHLRLKVRLQREMAA